MPNLSRMLLAAALVASTASAAPPRAPSSALGEKRVATPDAALAGTLAAPAAAPAREAPALEFERFRYAVEGQVSSKRKEEIADLEKLIRLGGSDAEMPGWLFRLYVLNPMAGPVDTFRRATVLQEAPDFYALGGSLLVTMLLLPVAYMYFRFAERTMADAV